MKKEVKAVIAVILAVWFFLMGFEIGGYREKKKNCRKAKHRAFS